MDPTDKRAVYLKRMGYQLDDSQRVWMKNSAGQPTRPIVGAPASVHRFQ
jgi:hypothetical protein